MQGRQAGSSLQCIYIIIEVKTVGGLKLTRCNTPDDDADHEITKDKLHSQGSISAIISHTRVDLAQCCCYDFTGAGMTLTAAEMQ